MAPRLNPKHDERTRQKIKTSQLVNRLNKIANGKIEVNSVQLKAIEIALRKTLPDLANITISGDSENPLNAVVQFGWKPPDAT